MTDSDPSPVVVDLTATGLKGRSRMRAGRPLARLFGLAVVASIAFLVPAGANAASPPTTDASLTLSKFCDDYPPFSGVRITLEGIPPNTPYTFTFEFGAGSATGQSTTTASGGFVVSTFSSSGNPKTYTLTIEWAGGTLHDSIYVDCSIPQSKEECQEDGWRGFDFKNQGECVAFVARGPR
jgi:hypothetical protein